MEFHEKLQRLRKQHHWTQEQLAEKVYVSRTAVSKWESGKGYPNIESLKCLSNVFSISIDELLSGNELLELTGAEDRTNINRVYGLVYGALDFIAILFLFLPLFGKADGGYIRAVSLLGAPDLSHGVQAVFYAAFLSMSLLGAVELILQQIGKEKGSSVCNACSVGFHVILVLVFSISRQPYATALLFALLMVKGVFALKKTNRL